MEKRDIVSTTPVDPATISTPESNEATLSEPRKNEIVSEIYRYHVN